MKNEIAIKIYEVDYSFIIKNYLDKELWSKSWTLFVYKDYIFTLNLAYINTESNSITFKIKCNYLHFDWEADVFDNSINVTHSLSNSNINVLKRQINGALFSAIKKIEKIDIVHSEEYQEIKDSAESEKNYLKSIAEDFLDENNVSNEEIRDAYVSRYVSNNSTINKQLSEYRDSAKYNVLTSLYLTLCKAIKDEDKETVILSRVNEDKREKILKEVNSYMEQLETEENTENLKNELEDI